MNDKLANDLIRYAELVEDGALISPEEMNCASVMRLAAEYLVQPAQEPRTAEEKLVRMKSELAYMRKAQPASYKQSTTCGEPVAKVCHDLDGHVGWNPKLTQLPDEGTPIYTTPYVATSRPQRTWEGLSIFEIDELVHETEYDDYHDLVKRTEALLEEKNNGPR